MYIKFFKSGLQWILRYLDQMVSIYTPVKTPSEQFLGLGNISCSLPSLVFLDCYISKDYRNNRSAVPFYQNQVSTSNMALNEVKEIECVKSLSRVSL